MSEESIHDTAPKATKALLGTIAFILIMVGIEALVERDGPRYGVGGSLIVAGIICSYAAVAWTAVRARLSDSVKMKIAEIALSPRWWLAVVLVGLMAVSLSPFIEQKRWPFSAWFAPSNAPSTDGCVRESKQIQERLGVKTQENQDLSQQLSSANNALASAQQQLATLRSQRSAPIINPPSASSITWQPRLLIYSVPLSSDGNVPRPSEPSVSLIDFRGTVQGSYPAQLKNAYIVSGLTGEKRSFLINTRVGYLDAEKLPLDQINPLPPG
ncbi:MAG: hypothetical protein WB816_05570, partial [Methylocystis sp.]